MRARHGAGNMEKERVRLLRNELLQRCMAVLLDKFAELSETGKRVNIPSLGAFLVVPRITLYAADMPEERHLLGLKIGLCQRPCSSCMIRKEEYGEARPVDEPEPDPRGVTETLTVQLEAASLYDTGTGAGRRRQISDDFSATHNVPALGSVHGLSTGCKNLYRIFGFDSLHVRCIVTLFSVICVPRQCASVRRRDWFWELRPCRVVLDSTYGWTCQLWWSLSPTGF